MNAPRRSQSTINFNIVPYERTFRALSMDDYSKIDRWFPRVRGTARYSDAWLYLTQACRGTGSGLGAIFETSEFFVGLGRHNNHWVLVRPHGTLPPDLLPTLLKMLGRTGFKMRPYVFVKKANENMREQFRDAARACGASLVGAAIHNWDRDAPHDDDTFPERLVDVADGGEHLLRFGENARRLRSKLLQYKKYAGRINFLTVHDVGVANIFEMIKFHFGSDISYVESYVNMLNILDKYPTQGHWAHFIPIIDREPVGLYAYESVDEISAGVYAFMAIKEKIYPGLAEGMAFELFQRMASARIKFGNLGGSETKGLDDFKLKFCMPKSANKYRRHRIFAIDFRNAIKL